VRACGTLIGGGMLFMPGRGGAGTGAAAGGVMLFGEDLGEGYEDS
jgi:hypothetical protein